MSAVSRFTAVTLLGTTLAIATPVSANLLLNGSFEQPDVPTGAWQHFTASQVDGWDGSNIEIWDNYNGVSAADGDQFAELNAHPSDPDGFGIFQEFATTAGQWYDLSFAYRARQSNNESFLVDVANSSWTIDDHVTGSWSVFTGSFMADTNLTTLRFTALVPESGTIGNFLDNVNVVASVPEPGTLALLGLGLAGLGLSRRKTSA